MSTRRGRAESEGALAIRTFDEMLGAPSWRPARTFLQAFYGEPMDDEAAALYRQCTARTTLPTRRANRALLLAGRRSGKSRLCGFLGAFVAACVRHDHVLARGEIGVVQIMAPSRMQAGIVFHYVAGFLDEVPSLQRMITRRTSDEIDIRNHGCTIRIAIATASYKLPRGFTALAFIGDESAFWEGDDSASPDLEIWRSVLPGLGSTGGPAIIISTPYSRSGLAFDLYDKHFGRDGSDTLVWMADTATMNPSFSRDVIDAAFTDDPESASSEYGRGGVITFRSDLQSLFLREPLYRCVRSEPRELPPQPGAHTAFVDMASGSDESAALGIAHRDMSGHAIIDLAREFPSPFDPYQVITEIATILRRYGCLTVSGDRYAPGLVSGAFEREGIKYTVAEKNKSELLIDCCGLVNAQAIQLPPDDRLLSQFLGLQRRVSRGGRDSVDHVGRKRDDLCNAVAGAAVCAAESTARVNLDAVFRGCAKNSGLRPESRVVCVLYGGDYLPADPICRKDCCGWRVVEPQWHAYHRAGGTEPLALFVRRRFTSASAEKNEWTLIRRQLEARLGV